MSSDLLQTKLFVPQLRPSLVPRPQIIEKLNQGLSGKLTLISAPAGLGLDVKPGLTIVRYHCWRHAVALTNL